ncbi:hypothetical protein M2280_006115 [Prescottella agglutinans]|uniref:Uncharacterized protein n=1 Tax=Prescottella agglutinans TaxID=1644129 RepID=A0ABT6MKK1_9NOCA|nr:hypothetical protein [Prescottella agglutinans]
MPGTPDTFEWWWGPFAPAVQAVATFLLSLGFSGGGAP